eukprot:234294-Heterocapsa_arctica.AAC.1
MADRKTARFHHGAVDLPELLDEVWPSLPGVGRFGLPADFGDMLTLKGPSGTAKKPLFIIFNERVCEMPTTVATRDDKLVSGPNGEKLYDASRSL